MQRSGFMLTAAALVVAMIAVIAMFGFQAAWGGWLFAAALVVGFGSHGWLMLGLLKDKSAP